MYFAWAWNFQVGGRVIDALSNDVERMMNPKQALIGVVLIVNDPQSLLQDFVDDIQITACLVRVFTVERDTPEVGASFFQTQTRSNIVPRISSYVKIDKAHQIDEVCSRAEN